MERVEKAGLGISLAGHVALVAALSLGLFAAKNKLPIESQPLDVQFVDEIGLKLMHATARANFLWISAS